MATIYDIAKAVGVSAATVSNALRGKGRISDAKRAEILRVAQESDYRPNLIARSLSEQRTQTMALVVPHIANPFYAEIAETIEIAAHARDVRMIFVNTNDDDELGKALLEDLIARRVDGILMAPGGISLDVSQIAVLAGVPIVYCLWEEENTINGASVGVDFFRGGQLAAQHLFGLGHRHIGVITHGQSIQKMNHHLRVHGFREALRDAGVDLDPQELRCGDSTAESGKREAIALLRRPYPPTALFATNDLMAIGALAGAWEIGFPVPERLSIIGFDDIDMAAYTYPALTTVRIDKVHLMQQALDVLFDLIAEKEQEVVIPPRLTPILIQRASTGPVNTANS